jgi:hypothetical protein
MDVKTEKKLASSKATLVNTRKNNELSSQDMHSKVPLLDHGFELLNTKAVRVAAIHSPLNRYHQAPLAL